MNKTYGPRRTHNLKTLKKIVIITTLGLALFSVGMVGYVNPLVERLMIIERS